MPWDAARGQANTVIPVTNCVNLKHVMYLYWDRRAPAGCLGISGLWPHRLGVWHALTAGEHEPIKNRRRPLAQSISENLHQSNNHACSGAWQMVTCQWAHAAWGARLLH